MSKRVTLFLALLLLLLLVLFSFLSSHLQTQSILKEILSAASDNSIRSTRSNNGLVNGESFSACLLIMDDNHRLVEWIAYNYFAMPLRFLVVAVDPHSKTSPTHILDHWRSSTDMTIVEWTDKNFTNENLIINATDDHNSKRKKHRTRQNQFYDKCAQFLKGQNRTWTVFYDTDEYMVINGQVVANGTQLFQQPGSILRMVHKYNHDITKQHSTNISSSSKEPKYWYRHFNQSACITIPRALFGTVESTNAEISKDVPSFLDPKQFDTLRYRYRAEQRHLYVWPGKSIIDVSKLHDRHKQFNAHQPYHFCPPVKDLKYNALPIGVHHMLGSWKSYSFREDARKNDMKTLEKWQELSVKKEGGADDDARPWIAGFVELVGEKAAKDLLQDAGLPPDYEKSDNDTASWHYIDFTKGK